MTCPSCIKGDLRTVETRMMSDGSVMRRRECLKCDFKVSTTEAILQAFHVEQIKQRLLDIGFTKEKAQEIIGTAPVKRVRTAGLTRDELAQRREWRRNQQSANRSPSLDEIGDAVAAFRNQV